MKTIKMKNLKKIFLKLFLRESNPKKGIESKKNKLNTNKKKNLKDFNYTMF